MVAYEPYDGDKSWCDSHPGQCPGYSSPTSATTSPSPTIASTPTSTPTSNFDTSVIVIEMVDPDTGATVIVVEDVYKTFSSTIPAGSPLPTAQSTSDPNGLLSQSRPAQTTTSSAQYDQIVTSTASPSSAQSSSPSGYGFPTTTAADTQSAATAQPQDTSAHHGGPPPIGAMVVVPIAIILGLIIAFVLWRRKRKARRHGAVASQEMKMRSPEDGISRGPPGYNESTNGLLITPATAATPLTARTTNNSLGPAASRGNRLSQNPVILDTNMSGGAYFTGIDTSDAVSMASGAAGGEARRSIDVNSVTSDEPPPPYRPRSVPSISREASLRSQNSHRQDLSVNTGLAAVPEGRRRRDDDDDDLTPTAESTPMRNPFEDPEDDAVSALSTPRQSSQWRWRRGDEDSHSMISEFSFEHEHR